MASSSPSSHTCPGAASPSGTRPGTGPIPTLPLGAGGPPRRAAGRVLRTAVVIDADPLRRLHALAAAGALGFDVRGCRAGTGCPRAPGDSPQGDRAVAGPAPIDGSGRAAAFVALDEPHACPRCAPAPHHGAPPAGSAAPLSVIGYGAHIGPLAAHRRHGCVDAVLQLTASCGEARFAYLPPVTAVDAADITTREADVLVLLLAGLDGPAVARRLGLSPATARAHCRAILRKLGAADRRALRARLLAASPAETSPTGAPPRISEICAVCSANFPEESPVALSSPLDHTGQEAEAGRPRPFRGGHDGIRRVPPGRVEPPARGSDGY